MTLTNREIFQHPGREIARTAHTVGLGVRRHWKSLMLAAAAVSIPAAFAINYYIGLNSQGKETTKVSDPYKPTSPDSGVVIIPPTATAESSPTPPPPESTATAIPTPESIDPAKCVFIKDPKICTLGQPRTREGMENQITGIEYNNIAGTIIQTRKGEFSVVKNNKTQQILGVSIEFEDGSIANINSDDLEIPDLKSRTVEDNEIVAKVGKSGSVSFSTGAKKDSTTGEYVTPSSFFDNNFLPEVIKKTKKILPKATGTPEVTVASQF